MSGVATDADYRLLGLQRGASTDEVKRAYRALARRYHPDVNPGDPQAERLFKKVTASYEAVLAHPLAPVRTAPRPQTPPRPDIRGWSPRPKASAPVRDRTVAGLELGEGRWFGYDAILVAPDRTVTLRAEAPSADYEKKQAPVRIDLRSDGYHVFIPPGPTHRWRLSTRTGLAVAALWVGDRQQPDTAAFEAALPRGAHRGTPHLPGRLLAETVGSAAAGRLRWTVAAAVRRAESTFYVQLDEAVSDSPSMLTPVRVLRDDSGFSVHTDLPAQAFAGITDPPADRFAPVREAIIGGASPGRQRSAL